MSRLTLGTGLLWFHVWFLPLAGREYDFHRDYVSGVPGFFAYKDSILFSLILGAQRAMRLHAHVLEIGSFHGRLMASLARPIGIDDRPHIIDTFKSHREHCHPNRLQDRASDTFCGERTHNYHTKESG